MDGGGRDGDDLCGLGPLEIQAMAADEPERFGRAVSVAMADTRQELAEILDDLDSGEADPTSPLLIWRAIRLIVRQNITTQALSVGNQALMGQLVGLVGSQQSITADVIEDLGALRDQIDGEPDGWDAGEVTGGYGE